MSINNNMNNDGNANNHANHGDHNARHNNNEDNRTYVVVVNHEEQYSLWLADRQIPPGWTAVGNPGTKAECLNYVEQVWTDMRPLSLRNQMAALHA
jgi:MbtH protein